MVVSGQDYTPKVQKIKPSLMTRWFQICFFFLNPYLGKIPILTNIFQMGCNQQLDDISEYCIMVAFWCCGCEHDFPDWALSVLVPRLRKAHHLERNFSDTVPN